MRILGDEGTIEFERQSLLGSGALDDDLLLGVTVRFGEYGAADQIWVVRRDWEQFLDELAALEARRQGEAKLFGASPGDFCLVLFAADRLGHVGARGYLSWEKTVGHRQTLSFSTPLESEWLPALVEHFREFGKPE